MGDLGRLLKESWGLVEEHQNKVAGYFYARLFLSNPHLRDLFPVHLNVRNSKLLGAVVTGVQDMDDTFLRELGRNHRKYGVGPEHFELFGGALIEAMRAYAGEEWTAEHDQAWAEAFALIAAKMLAGAEDEKGPAFVDAEVVAHERRAQDIAVFTVLPSEPLEFRAGQSVSLECPKFQPRLWRPYSPANAPRTDNTLEFHVRAVGAGWVSSALVRKLRKGDTVRLATPSGSMTLDRGSTRDAVFVAGGTGLAPLKSMLDELTRYNRTRWVHLFVGARDRDDLYDLPALRLLAERFPWLSLVPACSEDPTYGGEKGTIAEVVARYGPWNNHDFFVSGSKPMVQATLHALREIPPDRMKYDN